MKAKHLTMIGHGTNGSDGLVEGIHLRLGFDDKLGFPDCFRLYRRKSNMQDRYEFDIGSLHAVQLRLPFSWKLQQNTVFSFRMATAEMNGQQVEIIQIENQILPDGSTKELIRVTGEFAIVFSEPVSRIEVLFFASADSDFKVIAQTEEGDYYPYFIRPEGPGIKHISFDAPGTTGINFKGKEINLISVTIWMCTEGDEWKRINELCGCGLPVNQQGTPYTDDAYDRMGKDLATALCRLGALRLEDSPITAVEFLELKAMLLTMVVEGSEVPVGWTLFPDEEADPDVSLEFSKYDFLLTQSLQVFFARILGLYYVDIDVDNVTYYDYKVTAAWPEWNKRRLDHEILFDAFEVDESFFPVWQLNDHVVILGTITPRIVTAPYPLFRTELGLQVSTQNMPLIISFLQPVTEVQLVLVIPDFIDGSTTVTVEAYKNLYSVYVDREDLMAERGMLRLRAEKIDSIKIFATQVIICRIHYDFQMFPVGLQEYIVCGVKKQRHLPLTVPAGLKASFIPGGTSTDQDGNRSEKPYLACLRWKVNEDAEKELISIAPVLFHLERQAAGGSIELVTEEAPIFVSPSGGANRKLDIPMGWPQERQYYTEAVTHNGVNSYRIAAIDLFGRQSAYTEYVTYEITQPKPPHPTDVAAKFIDYSTYDSLSDSFSDVTLNDVDKDWLRLNRKNAIVVNWNWPENLQLQAPDVAGFTIHYKQGWLNTFTGIVLSPPEETVLTKTSLNLTGKELHKYAILEVSPEAIPVYRFTIALDVYPPPPPEPQPHVRINEREVIPENAFRLCWLTQGNHTFLILKNNSRTPLILWVLKVNDLPLQNKGFGIAITPDKEYFINYKNPEHWTDTRVFHQEPKNLTLKDHPANTTQPIYKEDYIVYIEDPAFPNPPLSATDRSKVRYAQIGVSAFASETEGSVSSPATIMAVYRHAPATIAAFSPVQDQTVQALTATAANVHGKSSFPLRWSKTNTGVKHHVFRALDETLFLVDNKVRQTRNNSVYTDFKEAHPEFDPADVDVLMQIVHESNPVIVANQYASLTPGQLQILASLPDNATAFTKINEKAIDENDPIYEDRVTEIPHPVTGATYTPDPVNILLYVDKTLNGQSRNRYFYAVQLVDTNGLSSVLSLATPPVEIPKTMPPPPPVITSVSSGENQITIRWAKNPGAEISGYLVYRTAQLKNTIDWRKMELIKSNVADMFSMSVDDSLPQKEFEFTDTSLVARQAHYYAVVAVGLSEKGKWLRSRMSKAKVGQAYDLTPPEPPMWDEASSGWVYIDEQDRIYELNENIPEAGNLQMAIRLVWQSAKENYVTQIARQLGDSGSSYIILNFKQEQSYLDTQQLLIDKNVNPGELYTYKSKSKSGAGLISTAESLLVINPAN